MNEPQSPEAETLRRKKVKRSEAYLICSSGERPRQKESALDCSWSEMRLINYRVQLT